ncbi:MAG: rhomboid family intramembrane serine protease, partial [Thermodesulfobacteriota bacterium]|nr:rhomboid family intramembrane serine protease [Thermodesulfobacteriota bacterium]
LHADAAHFLSNAGIGGILMAFLCQELRSGPGWVLFLLSGALGNLINAAVKGAPHTSIGASTGVFGAVGVLSALRAVRDRRLTLRRTFAPIAAGFALLAFLGTGGERTDLGAHVFGFLAGLILGASAGLWVNARGIPSQTANRVLGLMALALPVLAWVAAFSANG